MPLKAPFATILIAATSLPIGAAAQNVYKCGSAYSQQPCPGGQALTAGDGRSLQQERESAHTAKRDARLADTMEKDRLKQEAQAAPANVLPLPADMQERNARTPPLRKPEVFKAVSPAQPGAKPKKKKKKAKKEQA